MSHQKQILEKLKEPICIYKGNRKGSVVVVTDFLAINVEKANQLHLDTGIQSSQSTADIRFFDNSISFTLDNVNTDFLRLTLEKILNLIKIIDFFQRIAYNKNNR